MLDIPEAFKICLASEQSHLRYFQSIKQVFDESLIVTGIRFKPHDSSEDASVPGSSTAANGFKNHKKRR